VTWVLFLYVTEEAGRKCVRVMPWPLRGRMHYDYKQTNLISQRRLTFLELTGSLAESIPHLCELTGSFTKSFKNYRYSVHHRDPYNRPRLRCPSGTTITLCSMSSCETVSSSSFPSSSFHSSSFSSFSLPSSSSSSSLVTSSSTRTSHSLYPVLSNRWLHWQYPPRI